MKPLLVPPPLDAARALYDLEAIRDRLPQRHEMELLDRIVYLDPEERVIAGVVEVREDAFWVRGHFPARPILPGVLIIEAAGQLCSFYHREVQRERLGPARPGDPEGVLAFASAERVKFRDVVCPGDDLLLVAHIQSLTPRRARFRAEGIVGDRLVFEAELTGMVLR